MGSFQYLMETPFTNAAFEGWQCVRLLDKGVAQISKTWHLSPLVSGRDRFCKYSRLKNKPRLIYLAAPGLGWQLRLSLVAAPELLAAAGGQQDPVPCAGCGLVGR